MNEKIKTFGRIVDYSLTLSTLKSSNYTEKSLKMLKKFTAGFPQIRSINRSHKKPVTVWGLLIFFIGLLSGSIEWE